MHNTLTKRKNTKKILFLISASLFLNSTLEALKWEVSLATHITTQILHKTTKNLLAMNNYVSLANNQKIVAITLPLIAQLGNKDANKELIPSWINLLLLVTALIFWQAQMNKVTHNRH